MMWAKIGAGVIAALAVVSVGIYVAMPHECGSAGQCGGVAPKGSCCSGDHSDVVAPSEEGSCCQGGGCCSAGPAVDADALAACGGGLTVQPSAKAKKATCCGE
jgi:hypothetical protein